ncbi:hypothetical protein [Cecembia rubra]|uniref:hypothetical protein n=1 Tax=Cecembia rubra TaxID=1485585 RepID=UPI0027151A56|nr:hypothetical protein [Cecembia rubra]
MDNYVDETMLILPSKRGKGVNCTVHIRIKPVLQKDLGMYPKHELITSHSCRRTFATIFYKKIPTTILMGITGHVNESTFLKYINKQRDKDDFARLFLEYLK